MGNSWIAHTFAILIWNVTIHRLFLMLLCCKDVSSWTLKSWFRYQVSGVRREKDQKYTIHSSIIAFFRLYSSLHTHSSELSPLSSLNLQPETGHLKPVSLESVNRSCETPWCPSGNEISFRYQGKQRINKKMDTNPIWQTWADKKQTKKSIKRHERA